MNGPDAAHVRAVVVTTVARLGAADLAASSFIAHHRGADAVVVLVDDRFGEGEDAQAPVGVSRVAVSVADVGGDARELARLSLAHTPAERVRLLRPRVLARLLAQGAGASVTLVSLPDDAQVLAPLTTLIEAAERVGVGLVAVRRTPVPVDGRLPDRADLIADGRIDQELFAVSGAGGRALLGWWVQRVTRHPMDDRGRLDSSHHAWLDEAVFEMREHVRVLPPSLSRSYRNLDEVGPHEAPAVLRLPGFDPRRPWQLSDAGGNWPRTLLSTTPWLEQHADAYAQQLGVAIAAASVSVHDPYARLPQGHAVDAAMRACYFRQLLASDRHGTPEPPNPFVAGEDEAFASWLAEPSGPVTRYVRAIVDTRPDLAHTFAGDDGALARWAATDGRATGLWPRLLLPAVDGSPAAVEPDLPADEVAPLRERSGINVLGLLTGELGVGEVARLVLSAVERAQVPHAMVVDQATVHRRNHPLPAGTATGFRYDVDIVAVNADVTASTLAAHGRGGRRERPTIGVWAWEVLQFPVRMHSAFELLDEVWVTSSFMAAGIRPAAEAHGVSVHVIPVRLPYVRERSGRVERHRAAAALGVPADRPCFLFSFDYLSVAERKNPWGVVAAFREAFPTASEHGPVLVLKSINGEFTPMAREHLLHAIGHRPDIVLVETYLDTEQRHLLLSRADCYVSLHRSEGLGLTMAEAMGLGIPVIATGWSGNLDFMDATSAHLVDHTMIPIAADVEVYAGLGCWADPDIHHAARLMAQVVEHPDDAAALGAAGRAALVAHNQGDADARFVIDRLRAVRADRSSPTPRRTP